MIGKKGKASRPRGADVRKRATRGVTIGPKLSRVTRDGVKKICRHLGLSIAQFCEIPVPFYDPTRVNNLLYVGHLSDVGGRDLLVRSYAAILVARGVQHDHAEGDELAEQIWKLLESLDRRDRAKMPAMLVFPGESALAARALCARIRKGIPSMRPETLARIEQIVRDFHSDFERGNDPAISLDREQFRPNAINIDEERMYGRALKNEDMSKLVAWGEKAFGRSASVADRMLTKARGGARKISKLRRK